MHSFPTIRFRDRLSLLFLIMVALAVTWPLLFGNFYAVGDMRDVTIPLEIFFRQEFLAGHLPTWQPDVSWGFPVMASAQIGFWYPPLFIARFLPVWLYLPLIMILHTSALLVGLWLFLRRRVAAAPALFGALAFGLSAFVWQHASHLNIFLSVAWLPWQLLAADYVRTQPKVTSRALSLLAIVLGVPFLIGQLQLPFLQALFVFLYFFIHRGGLRVRSAAAIIVGTGMLLSGLAAIQIIPTIELLRESSRGSQGDFDTVRANQHSFPLYHLPTLVFPRFFGSDESYWGKRLEIEYGIFIGTIPALLALWQAGRSIRKPKQHQPTLFWLVGVILFFLLSLGSLSPFRLFGLEPSLWFFSAPARWLVFACLSLCVLAAYALHEVDRQRESALRFFKYASAIVLTVILAGNLLIFLAPELLEAAMTRAANIYPELTRGREIAYYQDKIASILHSAQISSVSWRSWYTFLPLGAISLALWAIRVRKVGVVLLATVVELVVVVSTVTPVLPWRQALEAPLSLQLLPDSVRAKQARVVSLQPDGDTGAWLTNPDSRLDAEGRARQRQLLIPLLSAQYGVAGVAWPASLDIQSQAQALEQLAISATGLDAAAAAQRTIGAVLAPESLRSLDGGTLIGSTNGVTAYALPAKPRVQLQGTMGGNVVYEAVTATHTRVVVDSPCECPLIIRDSFYPGWRAAIDGREVAVSRAEDIFRQLTVTPGHHVVDLYYRPRSLVSGATVSFIAGAVLLFLLRPFRARF